MYDVVIIGAGAAGIMCASVLKKENSSLSVLIIEKNDKLGKKLSMTGNGRCNLGNTNTDMSNYYSNIDLGPFKELLEKNTYLEYIKKIGVLLKDDDERIYPYSNQAITVCKSFERYLESLNVKIKYNYDVISVKKENDTFIINDDIKASNVIVATGGKSYPKTGSCGTGYMILKGFGHSINSLSPSLTYLKTDYKYIKDLAGVRSDGIVNLSVDNFIVDSEEGQIQFTKDALSGICVFNLSRNVSRYLKEGKTVKLILNLVPDYSVFELKDYFKKFAGYKIENTLSGILNNKLAEVISKEMKVLGKQVKSLTENELEGVIFNLQNMYFNIIGTGDFSTAQVTAGGASLDGFNKSLESKYCKGLYAIGEVLDVDGKCGGYNLAWAFTSALIVGEEISKNKN